MLRKNEKVLSPIFVVSLKKLIFFVCACVCGLMSVAVELTRQLVLREQLVEVGSAFHLVCPMARTQVIRLARVTPL